MNQVSRRKAGTPYNRRQVMAGEKTYSSAFSQYLDGAIADAEKQRAQATLVAGAVASEVAETVTGTVLESLRAALSRAIRRYFPTAIISLLPLLALGVDAALQAFSQLALLNLPARVALVGLAVFLPWQAWQAIRVAQGRIPYRLFRRRAQSDQYYDLPTVSEMIIPLVVGLLDVPVLLSVAFAVSLPNLVLAGLLALPVLVFVLVVVGRTVLLGLGAVGAVGPLGRIDEGTLQPVSLASLDERIARLTQIREWLGDDTLRVMVDDVIGQQVKSAARRQVTYSFVIGVISLVVGWLLSAVSPVATLTNLLQR
jgi:hypothetical protein